MDVSVIIGVAATDYGSLLDQIAMLQNQQTSCSYEVVLGDNDGLLELPPEFRPKRLKVVDASEQRGASFARNLAAHQASGSFFLFCDADDLVAPDWIDEHQLALQTHPLTAGSFLEIPAEDPCRDQIRQRDWPARERFSRSIRFHEGIPFATSANLGVRRETFHRVSGFPIEYLRSQDVAFSLAARVHGVSPKFVPTAQVVKIVKSRENLDSLRMEYRAGRSRVRMAKDFGVGPRSLPLLARGVLRTMRSSVVNLTPEGHARPTRSEAAQCAGIIRQMLKR